MTEDMSVVGDPIARAFEPLYGKPCWQAQRGYSAFLTFDFGEPRVEIDEPREMPYYLTPKKRIRFTRRMAYVRGQWHLWIYICDWSLRLNGKLIARAESANRRIERAVGVLEGQALKRVMVKPGDASTVFEFDLGGVLSTRPWGDNPFDEQWMLSAPSGNWLTARADGRYSYVLGGTSSDEEQWHSLTINGN